MLNSGKLHVTWQRSKMKVAFILLLIVFALLGETQARNIPPPPEQDSLQSLDVSLPPEQDSLKALDVSLPPEQDSLQSSDVSLSPEQQDGLQSLDVSLPPEQNSLKALDVSLPPEQQDGLQSLDVSPPPEEKDRQGRSLRHSFSWSTVIIVAVIFFICLGGVGIGDAFCAIGAAACCLGCCFPD